MENMAPAWSELPDFGLYMDQMVTFVARLYPGLPLTKGMINSYVKAGLIDRPEGKKYSRAGLSQLIVICCLKQTSSMEQLKRLLHPDEKADAEAVYAHFRACQTGLQSHLQLEKELTAMDCALRAAAFQQLCGGMLRTNDEKQEG